MNTETQNDPRSAQRLVWAREALKNPQLQLERASADAGFRSYWRTSHQGQTYIVMDSPPDKEDVKPWLNLRAHFENGEVYVPQVLAEDIDNGFLLLNDLGSQTLLHVINLGNADAFFDQAIDQLLRIQQLPIPEQMPHYDEALLQRELSLFDEWFLKRHLGIEIECEEWDVIESAYRLLINRALQQAKVLVHRDFMPRNLMPHQDQLAVLDFQDAVHGPIAYDALSLFKDAFHSWPEENVQQWLAHYHRRATDAGLPVPQWKEFRKDADWIGLHRHLKVIGIFARLNYRDNKPKYLADAPRFFDYLDGVLPYYEEFNTFHHYLKNKVYPRMQRT
jgi:N-acetylmuramate 1-kinase